MTEPTPATGLPRDERATEEPAVLEEIVIEELSVDGVCGVY
jgi:mycofactocin precursor